MLREDAHKINILLQWIRKNLEIEMNLYLTICNYLPERLYK